LVLPTWISIQQAARDAETTGASTSEEELADAEEAVAEFESSSSGMKKPFASLLEVAGLIFLAEWGDRSMLATIALGAAQVGGVMLVTCGVISVIVAAASGVIFLAEWGDRSMLATIALGAAQVGGMLLVSCVVVSACGVWLWVVQPARQRQQCILMF
jgi:putative Ca2+/H+ antiporter (TMEM165/GDT1 family)